MSSATPEINDSSLLKFLYWALALIGVGLAIWGVATYGAQKETQEAIDKAAQLTQKYQAAGLTAPPRTVIIRTLGTDGGNVCENPANALGVAHINDQLTNGGSHVGRRPVIANTTSLEGQKLIFETYCPDELEEFQEELSEYKTDNTVKE